MKHRIALLPLLVALLAGCTTPNDNPTDPAQETGAPEIQSLTAEKTQILYGGQDPAIITCNATGGNLTYKWEVDLGDIIPMNASRSKISFNGSACCVGEKTITCTVSNSLGSVSKTIIITILEVITIPEIIALEADKTTILAGAGETASFVCYAIGGHLRYHWESDCGTLSVNAADSSKASMTAAPACIGARNVRCTVTNEMGTQAKTVQITIGQ